MKIPPNAIDYMLSKVPDGLINEEFSVFAKRCYQLFNPTVLTSFFELRLGDDLQVDYIVAIPAADFNDGILCLPHYPSSESKWNQINDFIKLWNSLLKSFEIPISFFWFELDYQKHSNEPCFAF